MSDLRFELLGSAAKLAVIVAESHNSSAPALKDLVSDDNQFFEPRREAIKNARADGSYSSVRALIRKRRIIGYDPDDVVH